MIDPFELRGACKPCGDLVYLDEQYRPHNKDSPAVMYRNGDTLWYEHGKLHRENGPAIEYPTAGMYFYYEHGVITQKHIRYGEVVETSFYKNGHLGKTIRISIYESLKIPIKERIRNKIKRVLSKTK